MISLETQNRQKFIGKLELNLEKSPEKEPEKKKFLKTKTKRNKKIEISDLKNFTFTSQFLQKLVSNSIFYGAVKSRRS